MFQIEEFTEAKLASITNRVKKHGDDDKPAVSLSIEIETANTILDSIDPTLRQALYKAKSDAEPELPGVEKSTPVLRSNSIDKVALETSHEGWVLAVDNDIDEQQPMLFGGAKVDKFTVEPKQGGSIVLRLRVGTSDIDAERMGWLGMHNGQPIWITLKAPEKKADEPVIDGTTGHPGAAPNADDGQGDLLAPGGSGEQTPEAALAAANAQADKDRAGENWPLGANSGADGTNEATGETKAAGGEPTGDAAEFEAGAAKAIKDAGVRPKKQPAPAKARGRSEKRTAGAVE